ncbi:MULTISPECIES: hypothetical protein [Burkholderia]|nr:MULTISPECIES: hypothetical protein [Burkholderia cepacia complex]
MEQVRIGSDLVAQAGMKMDEIVPNVDESHKAMSRLRINPD